MNINSITPTNFKATIERPLAEFDFFYEGERGITILMEKFWMDAEELNAFNINKDKFFFKFQVGHDENGHPVTYTEEFEKYLYQYLFKMHMTALNLIYEKIDLCNNNDLKKTLIKNLLDILYNNNNISNKRIIQFGELYRKPILSVVKKIKNRYQHTINFRHKILSLIFTENTSFSLLGYKYSIATINGLYDLLANLLEDEGLCNEEIDQYEIFKLLVISEAKSPVQPLIIYFNNKYLALILKEMEDLFNNLSFTTITDCNAIIKKNGSSYKRHDLDSALNKAMTLKNNKKYKQFHFKLKHKIVEFKMNLKKR